MTLTETLEQQHAAVVGLINAMQAAVERSDHAVLRLELDKLGGALIAHLELEDLELYPGLERMAVGNGNEQLALVARQFSSNMVRISDALLAFLRKYTGPITDLAAFSRDWSHIRSVLVGRIAAEEGTLYPLFDKASGLAKRKRTKVG